MFSLARALSSPASAEDGSSLFDRFTGTTARSDSSRACPSAVRLSAFSDRSRSWLDREAPEVSRFSCMLFLSVRGFLDYAEPTARSRIYAAGCVAFPQWGRGRRSDQSFSKLNSPAHRSPIYASTATSRRQSQDSGSGWSRCLLSCRALSSPATCRFSPAHPQFGFEPRKLGAGSSRRRDPSEHHDLSQSNH